MYTKRRISGAIRFSREEERHQRCPSEISSQAAQSRSRMESRKKTADTLRSSHNSPARFNKSSLLTNAETILGRKDAYSNSEDRWSEASAE